MKIQNKDLRKAHDLVKSGKYPQAIRFLEPKVPLYLEDDYFYYLLGKSCLHTGDIGGAEFYFKRSLQVNSDSTAARLYLAAVQLRKKDQANAARLWLNILDVDPQNTFAKKGLESLKKIENPTQLELFVNSRQFYKLTPGLKGFHPLVKKIFIFSVILALFSIILFFTFPYLNFKPLRNERMQAVDLSLNNYMGSLVDSSGDFLYELSGDEIKKLFESAVTDFHNYDDNALQMKINKINLSNASEDLKGKINLLENLIEPPNFMTIKTRFTYEEVAKDPQLYNNCFILWSGRVTNVNFLEDKITLDFLVGYEKETVLKGIVSVNIPFETKINETIPLEILGQIRYRNGKISITALSLRPII